MSTVVRSQAEFDAALAALNGGFGIIEIHSEPGVWISVSSSDSATVRASDSATVEAWGSATVEASNSATVEASDSATVRAWGSATVRAWGSATVEAWGSATVEASDSATVRAWGSATVEASDSATVRAWGSAKINASRHVAVHLHSKAAVVEGGVLIDVTEVNETGPAWLEHHGIETGDSGLAVVFKAVNDQWTTDRGFDYSPGSRPVAEDWNDRDECGGGLHFGPTPAQARAYFPEATKVVACEVLASELRPITGGTAKAKARTCEVLYDVDLDGNRIGAAS